MHAGVTNLEPEALQQTLVTTSSHTHALLLLDDESSDDVARDASTITTSQSRWTVSLREWGVTFFKECALSFALSERLSKITAPILHENRKGYSFHRFF